MAFGSPDERINSYIYGTQFPELNKEGGRCSVTLTFEPATDGAFATINQQMGLIKNIPADVYPVRVFIDSADLDSGASLDADLTAVLSDDSEVQILNSPIGSGANASVDDLASGDFVQATAGALVAAIGGKNYDLVFDTVAAAAGVNAGVEVKVRIEFERDVRGMGVVHNELIADGQNS